MGKSFKQVEKYEYLNFIREGVCKEDVKTRCLKLKAAQVALFTNFCLYLGTKTQIIKAVFIPSSLLYQSENGRSLAGITCLRNSAEKTTLDKIRNEEIIR